MILHRSSLPLSLLRRSSLPRLHLSSFATRFPSLPLSVLPPLLVLMILQPATLVMAWHLGAKTCGVFTKDEFMTGFEKLRYAWRHLVLDNSS